MSSYSSGKRPSDAEWLQHIFTIERMFLEEKKSLVETRQRLENDGFPVTKAQLEYKLKLWGFRRRIPKNKTDAVWKFIGRRVRRRKEQGKETEVTLGKEIVDAAKVCKEIKRYQETMFDRFIQRSPTPLEGVEISLYTPAPLPVRFLWPPSLPWSRFQDSFLLAFSAPGLLKNMNNISKELSCRKDDLYFTYMVRLIAPQYAAGSSVSQLAAEIGSTLPETHENENFDRASRLLQGTADERYSEYVKMILYKISNNLLLADEIQTNHVNPWRNAISGKVSSASEEWENITEMLETSGIMKAPFQLGNNTDATTTAIMEKLFQNALRNIGPQPPNDSLSKSSCGRIIEWLLQSGQNPNIRVQDIMNRAIGFSVSIWTPLQMAARMRSLQLMSRLLDHGACPNLSFEPWDGFDEFRSQIGSVKGMHPLLEVVRHYNDFDEGRLGMIERLLKMRLTVSVDSIIRMMMNCGRYLPKLMEALIRNGADIFQSIRATTGHAWFIDTFSIIGCTANYHCEPQELHPFFRLLEDAGIQNRFQIPETVNTTSIVLLAAADGNTAFLEELHSCGIDTTATGSLGSSAIHVAAYYGHLETCKTLVVQAYESNKQISFPLHSAVAGRSLDIVHSLHRNKIDVNEVFEDLREARSVFRKWETGGRQAMSLDRLFTALDVVLEFNRFDMTHCLLDKEAENPLWGACATTNCQEDVEGQELAKITPKAGADPPWGVRTPSTISNYRYSICCQFREALKHDTGLAQRLVLDAHQHDLWDDPYMSILEAAIITCHENTVDKIFALNPGAYDPGALYAKVLFSTGSRDNITINRLLSNRPQSEETSPLEALAIGLAAWSGQTEVLEMLLAEIDQPMLAKVPRALCNGLPRFSPFKFAINGLPFWHRPPYDLQFTSPILFALGSIKTLSLVLNHGYKSDRLTMRAAINDFDRDIVKTLLKSPRLSNCPGYTQGPLSYVVAREQHDVVRFLLENGEDVNEDNSHVHGYDWESARSPLQSAVGKSDLYLIDLLLKSGADVNTPAARYRGATAVQLAAISGRLGILRTLIDHGADVNAPGAESGGRTALEGAAEHGRIDIIQYLLSLGARTTDRDRMQYLRAIRYAQLEAHEAAASLLRDHREWTADDQILWKTLAGLDREQLESFKEDTQEVPSSLNLLGDTVALNDTEVGDASTKDGSGPLGPYEDVYDPTEGMEPPDDLQDLEMRMSDPMVFMIGEM
ncbi:Ankyrin repeat domain-containing protein 50 [Colletotrichum siamense]|uniref:Ankyrin repeat domain-containing protein 50 n=1 Tax=Colletotrichum siamense TaxID=690259 RepID=UPI001872B13F|nr:Ankyrin repeat domain-containing protein 50 [Colletotrichum siamense]KAF5497702.1 Ankyrin repeat domain-containing protein 50 [Colletotrichum siamense]